MNKQASGGQFLPLINGTPIHDVSQKFMVGNLNLVQCCASPAAQGFPNRLYSHAQSQDLHSMDLVPQQLDVSLYGIPIASAKNNLSQYSHLQGLTHDSANGLTRSSDNQTEKPIMPSSGFSTSFMGDHCNVSSDQLCMPDGALMSKQVFNGKNLFGQVPLQGFNSGVPTENFQQVNNLQRNASVQEFSGRQEQAGWPVLFPGKSTQICPSQGLTTLDPLEQKILFNMDDNSWNDSFGRNTAMGLGGFGNVLECSDFVSSFPSIQSGSWSALMQSAVAETSSSDNGLQEEWSGLSYQNTELSTDNQPTNFVDSGKQQTGWVDNNVQSASSLSSKPQFLFNDSNMSSGFPGFQQSGIQFSMKQREGMHSDSSPESVQQSPKNAVKWLDCNTQHNQSIEVSQLVRTMSPFENENAVNKSWMGDINGVVYKETSQCVLEHHQLAYMKHNDISEKNKGHDSTADDLHQLSDSQILAYSYEGAGEACEKQQNCYQRENSNDSYHSNASQHTITEHEMRENMWLHDIDSQLVVGGNHKSSGQVLRQQVSQGLSSHEQGYLGQFKFVGNASNSAVDLEKGRLSDIQRNLKASEELPPRGNIGANMSASFNGSVGIHSSNLTSQTRQNMLELLHKRDHSMEQSTVTHFSSTDTNPLLEVPEAEIPEGNCTAASPTDNIYLRNQFQRPHLPPDPIETQSPQATSSGMASRLPHFNCATSQGSPSINVPSQPHLSAIEACKVPSNLLLAADSMSKSLQTTSWATQELHDQNSYRGSPSQEFDSCSMNSQSFDSGEEHPRKESSQQQISSEILDQVSDTCGLAHGQEFVPKHLSETNAIASVSLMAHPIQQDFDGAPHGVIQSPAISANDFEAFGRSLKPSNLHQTYSQLHRVHSMKHVETDPSKRVLEKNHRAGSELNVKQITTVGGHQMMYGHNSGVRNPVKNGMNVASKLNSFPTKDVKMPSFSSEVREDQLVKASSLPLLQDTPQEMVTPCQSYSESHPNCDNATLNRTEHSQISLKMEPSWFKHYETLGNRQMLPMYDARTAKNSVQQFLPGKPFENLHMTTSMVQVSAAGASHVSNVWPTTATTLSAGKQSHPYMLTLDVTDQNLSVTRLRKRKIEMSELLSWHKEVTQHSKRRQNISTTELEWAQATNRLAEKAEAEAEMIEDMHPLLQPKKRLVLTTQLMQQVFRPAVAAILSADATSNYDSVAYFAAKLALGDACGLTSCSISDSCSSSNSYDTMSEDKTSERIGARYFSKTVEDFTKRAKKLENDLLRSDKTASVVDIRVEYQELEKFSVINRFAKFHFRGQPDVADASSSSGTTPTVLKSFPLRYVTAFPMPRAVPDGAQCLPL